jgi:hypothetical protein
MSPCCSSNTFAAQPSAVALVEKGARCPSCGETGRLVKSITLQSLLKPEALPLMDDGPYHFCGSQECDVVYFGNQGVAPFLKDDLTVRVGVKETMAPRRICYCFNHTIEEIEEEVRCSGKTTVLEDIKRRMKTACWCETKSPQGSCCLATVCEWVQRFANSR